MILKRLTLAQVLLTAVLIMSPFYMSYAGDPHKLAIHIDRSDELTQRLTVSNASKALEVLQEDVVIDVVIYGPGMALVTQGGKFEKQVSNLMKKGVKFHLCEVTVKKMTKKSGKAPNLLKGVNIVPSGTVKLMQLQEDGYVYLRP